MADSPIRLRTWVRGSVGDQRSGLLGWISVFVGDLIVDNITLRRMATGRLGLSFPQRRDKSGREHAIVRPLDNEARLRIEREVLGQLGQREDLGVVAGDRP